MKAIEMIEDISNSKCKDSDSDKKWEKWNWWNKSCINFAYDVINWRIEKKQ